MSQRPPGAGLRLYLSQFLPLNQDQLILDFTRYFRGAIADQDVDLTAHAELRQIDTRLDGKARIGDDLALVLGLKVVHVGAVAVHRHADGVPGAVDKIFSVPSGADALARGLVHFPAGDLPFAGESFLDFLYASIPRRRHNIKDLNLFF